MSLGVLGLSHHTAPLAVRERFALDGPASARLLKRMVVERAAREAVLLSTCNRTELYLFLEDGADPFEAAVAPLAEAAGYAPDEAAAYLYGYGGRDVVRHLFRVVSSLDSMVVGEAQIQGQVRAAYEHAVAIAAETKIVGPVLSRLFQTALSVGGRVRSDTALGTGAASIPSAAVELATKIFGSLRGRRALIVGAGETAQLAIDALRSAGVTSVTVANRTAERAAEVAARVGSTAIPLSRLGDALRSVDIVATATAGAEPVLTRALLRHALPNGPRDPLFIIDMGVPRDVEAAVGDLDNVFLYDVDDLRQIVDVNVERRASELPAAERIIDQALGEFWAWYASLEVVPVIRALRGGAEAIRRAELEKALRRLEHLAPEDREAVELLTRQLVNKLLHDPTVRLREAASNGRGVAILDAARYLFRLDAASAETSTDQPGTTPRHDE